jgi:hypothetical protein
MIPPVPVEKLNISPQIVLSSQRGAVPVMLRYNLALAHIDQTVENEC